MKTLEQTKKELEKIIDDVLEVDEMRGPVPYTIWAYNELGIDVIEIRNHKLILDIEFSDTDKKQLESFGKILSKKIGWFVIIYELNRKDKYR